MQTESPESGRPAPELSILMVNWNTREMTLTCLRSLFAQTTETDFEVILVDNDSADGSADAIAEEFPQVRLLREDANHGFAKATNMAADIARGRLFLLLNTDTEVLDHAIDRLVAFSKERPDAGMWGGRTLFGDGSLNYGSCYARITPWSAFCMGSGLTFAFKKSPLFNPEAYGAWQRDSERAVDIVSGCMLLMRADYWKRLGGFDPAFFMYGEEADLCARARAIGVKPRITPDATIIHHGGASSKYLSKKICYVLGARVGLIDRHISGPMRIIARQSTILGAAWRALTYKLAAAFGRKSAADHAREWQIVWSKRDLWKHGPVAKAL